MINSACVCTWLWKPCQVTWNQVMHSMYTQRMNHIGSKFVVAQWSKHMPSHLNWLQQAVHVMWPLC